jgi:iron-sulfur cluster repair protein YtfE (RIC family)
MSDASSCAGCTNSTISADCTVDAALRKSPSAAAVFDQYNIDSCCGGKSSIRDAALHAHVDPEVLVGALNAAPSVSEVAAPRSLPQAASCGCGCR